MQFIFRSFGNLKKEATPLADQHIQKHPRLLFTLVRALDVFAFGRVVARIRSVKPVCGNELLEVGTEKFIALTKNKDIVHAVRRFVADLESLQVIEDRDRLPPDLRK